MTVATEERGGGTLFRRIVVLLSVVALMAVMLAMGVGAAFAVPLPCPGNNGSQILSGSPSYDPAYDSNNNGIICKYDRYDHNGGLVSSRFKDDRIVF